MGFSMILDANAKLHCLYIETLNIDLLPFELPEFLRDLVWKKQT